MDSNLNLQDPIVNNAFESLTELLWNVFQEGSEDLDKVIDPLIHSLLRDGPRAFDKVQDIFPAHTRGLINSNQAYQTYLNTCLNGSGNQSKAKPSESLNGEGNSTPVDPKAKETPDENLRDSRLTDNEDIRNARLAEEEERKREQAQERAKEWKREQDQLERETEGENETAQPDEVKHPKKVENPPDNKPVPKREEEKKEEVAPVKPAEKVQKHEGEKKEEVAPVKPAEKVQKHEEEKKEEKGPVTFSRKKQDAQIEKSSAVEVFVEDGDKIEETTLEAVFKLLKKEVKVDYDQNFTLVYGGANQKQQKKDEFITAVAIEFKDKDFTSLFSVFKPFLFDLLKRREGFEEFVQVLRRVSAKEKLSCHKIIKSLEVKDVIVLLLESCTKKSMAKLGPWLTNQFYPLPIFYPIAKKGYKVNLDCCLELMFQVRKMLITSVGTPNSVRSGKSSLLSYLFSIKNPTFFSTANSFTHTGSIDLYAKSPQESFKYIVADVNGHVEDKDFKEMMSKLFKQSHLVLVQISIKDVCNDVEDDVNMAPLVESMLPAKTDFVFLLRDYDEDEHESLLGKISDSLEKYPNFHGTIPVKRLDAPQNMDAQNDKLDVLEKVTEVLNGLKGTASWPIADLRKAYDPVDQKFDEDSVAVQRKLDEKSKEKKTLYCSLFPCFWLDYLLNIERRKKRRMDITRSEWTEDQVREFSRRYEEITKVIEQLEAQKTQVKASSLIQDICGTLSSNDIAKTLLLAETINDWKTPIIEPLKKKYLELCTDKKSVKDDQKNALDQEIKRLEEEMDDKDITLDTFLDEIHSLYEAGKVNDTFGMEGIREYIYSTMQQGSPINLVNGKTLTFGSKLLRELFENYDQDSKKVYVVSIIGAQSSAKSTLLNVLFGCGFATSAGRCTKGLYITLLEHPNGCHLIVIDTEGLLSVVARDHEFDNLITTMAFSCSHIVIINNKGEINTKLRDLLEICVYAMKHLRLTNIKPKIIFALRDMADDNPKVQQEMLIHMKNSLDQAAKKLMININNFIDISEQDVFLLPSAFQLSRGESGSKVQSNNNLFSQKVLDMRNYIFQYLETTNDNNSHSISSPGAFYRETKQLWESITEHGKDIMKAKNFLEIELKDDALDKVNLIYRKFNEIFYTKGRALLEYQKNELKGRTLGFQDDFAQLLTSEFNKMKKDAIEELNKEVINNDKYDAISGYHRELKETLEYYLGWQRQNFVNEWRSSLISYETTKNMSDFKAKLKIQVDDILQNKAAAETLKNNILTLFEQIKKNTKQDLIQKLQRLKEDNINTLVPEIQGHFEYAQQKRSRKDRERIKIPSVGELVQRIRIINGRYREEKWVKLNGFFNMNSASKIDKFIQRIAKEFNNLQNELLTVIGEVSSEDVASNIISMCIDRIKKLEAEGVPVNFAEYMHCCLLESMFSQYNKTKEAENQRMLKFQTDLEDVLAEEEKHINGLLDQSHNNFNRGEATAKKCYKEIQRAFCEEQEAVLQDAVMLKIREEFPAPESANVQAYKSSFEISNYENVVKYVLNINKFIRELYDQKIKTIIEFEIDRRISKLKNDFVDVIQQTIDTANQWYRDNENNQRVDLSLLYGYAQRNPKIANYFPELYIVQVADIKSFAFGFDRTLASQLKEFDTGKELKEVILKKVEEYLSNQYQTLVGCQSRCPICNNKCTRPDPNHKDHHTNCHLLTGFSGVQDKNTKEVQLSRCFDPSNYKCTWYSGEEVFQDFDAFIGNKYPEWRKEFPTKDQPDKFETAIDPKMIECWVGTKEVLIKYFGYKDKTPADWEKQVPKDKRLRGDKVIPGYTKK